MHLKTIIKAKDTCIEREEPLSFFDLMQFVSGSESNASPYDSFFSVAQNSPGPSIPPEKPKQPVPPEEPVNPPTPEKPRQPIPREEPKRRGIPEHPKQPIPPEHPDSK